MTNTTRTEYPYSTATSTEWGFTSASTGAGKTTQLPLVQLDYGIDTDTVGKVARTATLLVTPSHIPGAAVAAVRTDSVELSYDDGKTWKKGKLSSSSHGASTRLNAPATGPTFTALPTAV